MKEQTNDTKMHALDYWQVVRNRWGVILLTFFLITLASLVIIALLDKKYAGRTKFQILQSSAPDVFSTITNDFRQTVSANWLETQYRAMTAKENLKRVVKRLNLDTEWRTSEEDAASRLERMLETEQERGTEIVTVTAWSTNASESMYIANEVRKAYGEWRTESEKDRITRLSYTLTSQIKSQDEEVERTRQEMNDLAKKHNIVDRVPLSTGQGYSPVIQDGLNDADAARAYMNKLEEDMLRLKTQFQGLIGLEGEKLIAGAMELGVQNSTIQKLYPEYQSEVAIKSSLLKSGFGPRHPKILGLQESTTTKYGQLKQAAEIFRDNLKMQLEQQTKMVADAKARAEGKTTDFVAETQNQNEYASAKRKHEAALMLLNSIKEHAMKMKVDEGVTKKPIEVLEEAKAEVNPSKPNVMLLLSIGAGLGLLLGLLLAFFLEYLDTSVKSLDDVERYLGVPVLAVIPKDVGVLHKQSGLSPDAEAYRILRTNIEFNRRSADANAITIVSGGAGEGKSTTLVNLAYICAQGGYNTLMIDGDLRRPKLHTFFDINNSVGLTNYLTTALMLEDVVLQTPIENLYFMPSGILPADAAGILNSRRMSELIADVKNRFDLVLIDSPPILGVSDASVLASEVDLTIVVIQHRKLPRNMLLRVKAAIENVGGNLLGVVLNNVDVRSDSQYQYYTSYYTYYSPTNVDTKAKARPSAPQQQQKDQPAAKPSARPAGAPSRGADKDDY
jgi:polysaccharide biosynthesis transport protein